MQPLLRNWAWLYRWLLAALAETAVVIPWVILFYSLAGVDDWEAGLPGIWLLLLTYLAAAAWERGAPPAREEAGRRRVVAMLVGIAASSLLAYLALPSHLRAVALLGSDLMLSYLPIAGYLFYQGARMGGEGLFHAGVYQRFLRQCATLLAGILVVTLAGVHRHSGVLLLLYWSVPLLAGAGLTLLAVTREQAMRSEQAREGDADGAGGSLSRVTGSVVLGLLALTLLAATLLSPDRLADVTGVAVGWIGAVWAWLVDVVMLILYRWIAIVEPLVTAVTRWVLSTMGGLSGGQQGQGEPEQIPELDLPEQELIHTEALMPYVRAALVILGLVGLAVWLYRSGFRRREQQGQDEEERISLGFWSSLMADLKGLLSQVKRQTRGAVEAAREALEPEQPDGRDPRVLYRRLQTWGRRIGRPRRPDETPNRYRGALAGLRPGAQAAVSVITAVYNRARYGPAPPGVDEVEKAVRAAEELPRHERTDPS